MRTDTDYLYWGGREWGELMLGGSREQESEGDGRQRVENKSWRSDSLPDHPTPLSSRKLSEDQILKLPPAPDSGRGWIRCSSPWPLTPYSR